MNIISGVLGEREDYFYHRLRGFTQVKSTTVDFNRRSLDFRYGEICWESGDVKLKNKSIKTSTVPDKVFCCFL